MSRPFGALVLQQPVPRGDGKPRGARLSFAPGWYVSAPSGRAWRRVKPRPGVYWGVGPITRRALRDAGLSCNDRARGGADGERLSEWTRCLVGGCLPVRRAGRWPCG